MEAIYRLKPLLGCLEDDDDDVVTLRAPNCSLQLEAPLNNSDISSDQMIKIQIANHPLYPDLLSAYIECQKVGSPPELACLLEEIARESHRIINVHRKIGEAPELDHFMETFCQVLHRYKEELSRPFNEATLFLGDMESQLNNLCNGTLPNSSFSDEVANNSGASEEELSCGEMEGAFEDNVSFVSVTSAGDKKLKEMLLRKYSGHFSGLRNEFLKRRKKGKLPRDARVALMDWWNAHSRWPYPTEEEKVKLSEMSGLDQKQINNWFINQRKRHWKPTEEMGFGVIDGLGGGGPMLF